jgi:hypothetical protein
MRHPSRMVLVGVFALHLISGGARAGFATSVSSIPAPVAVIDFSQFSGPFDGTAGPVQVGGLVDQNVVYTSTSSNSVIGNGDYGLGPNGYWTSGRLGFVGTNDATAAITFTFKSDPVSAVGGFVNYSPGSGDFTITALSNTDTPLESYDVTHLAPIFTTSAIDRGAFRGIVRSSADIYGFEIQGAYGVLDNLTFTRPATKPVPEPPSLAIFVIGIAAVGGFRICRRRRMAARLAAHCCWSRSGSLSA